jgi:uncharacterized membrane protein YccC
MSPRSNNLTFALANTSAVLGALFIAFALNLERPYWAMFTVFIIARPISGAVRSKGVYRLLGTTGGAAMALFLVPLLVQTPVLLCLTISGWVGFCLYVSLLDRTPRSYIFMLAGYTAAIVAFSVVDRPDAVFATAVARLEEIWLGIVCAAVAHSIFFPNNAATSINKRIERAIEESANWIADTLKQPPARTDARTYQRLARELTDLHLLYTHVAFETSDVPRARRIMQVLQERLSVLPVHLTSVQKALEAQRTRATLCPEVSRRIDTASDLARRIGSTRWASARSLERLSYQIDDIGKELTGPRTLLEQAITSRLVSLLKALAESRILSAALKDPVPQLPIDLQLEVSLSTRRPLHVDHGIALLSACAATASCLVACALWIHLSWPEGGVAAQFAAIGCSLPATLDRPSKVVRAGVLGIVLALPFGALYVFAVFPRIDGFASLAFALLPALFLLSLMQASEKFGGVALVLAVAFSGALALQPTYQADFASFVNANTAEVIGLLIADAMLIAFRTIGPRWNAVRISRQGWRAVSDLASNASPDAESWSLPMFDRLGLVLSRLRDGDRDFAMAAHIDPLRDLRVGFNLATLKRAEIHLSPTNQATLRSVSANVAAIYRRHDDRDVHALSASLDAAIGALTTEPPSAGRRTGLAALTLLQLELAPATPQNLSEETGA